MINNCYKRTSLSVSIYISKALFKILPENPAPMMMLEWSGCLSNTGFSSGLSYTMEGGRVGWWGGDGGMVHYDYHQI